MLLYFFRVSDKYLLITRRFHCLRLADRWRKWPNWRPRRVTNLTISHYKRRPTKRSHYQRFTSHFLCIRVQSVVCKSVNLVWRVVAPRGGAWREIELISRRWRGRVHRAITPRNCHSFPTFCHEQSHIYLWYLLLFNLPARMLFWWMWILWMSLSYSHFNFSKLYIYCRHLHKQTVE